MMSYDLMDTARHELMEQASDYLQKRQDSEAFIILNGAMRLITVSEALSHPDVAECMTLMGGILLKHNQPAAAERYLRLALFVYDKAYANADCPEKTEVIRLLFAACRRQGNFSAARELKTFFKRAS